MSSLQRIEPTHRFVEHIGEVEVELTAGDETGIFSAGLAALAELMSVEERGAAAEAEVELTGGDRGLLLLDWLDELLYLGEVQELVPAGITAIVLDDEGIHAHVAGYRAPPRSLVKGVALHGLRYERDGDVWHAHVVFDV